MSGKWKHKRTFELGDRVVSVKRCETGELSGWGGKKQGWYVVEYLVKHMRRRVEGTNFCTVLAFFKQDKVLGPFPDRDWAAQAAHESGRSVFFPAGHLGVCYSKACLVALAVTGELPND